jgi:hypothetical protein
MMPPGHVKETVEILDLCFLTQVSDDIIMNVRSLREANAIDAANPKGDEYANAHLVDNDRWRGRHRVRQRGQSERPGRR